MKKFINFPIAIAKLISIPFIAFFIIIMGIGILMCDFVIKEVNR